MGLDILVNDCWEKDRHRTECHIAAKKHELYRQYVNAVYGEMDIQL